jgi:hypothetical protein
MESIPALAGLPPATAEALLEAIEPGEEITHAVPAIGCTIALTERRLIIVRDGAAFRPKSGVRRWNLDEDLTVRTGFLRHGTGSIVVQWDRNATSVFVQADHWDEALKLGAAARNRLRRAAERGLPG